MIRPRAAFAALVRQPDGDSIWVGVKLEALANGQVEELLISGAAEESHLGPEQVEAICAPEIPDGEGGTESDEPGMHRCPICW